MAKQEFTTDVPLSKEEYRKAYRRWYRRTYPEKRQAERLAYKSKRPKESPIKRRLRRIRYKQKNPEGQRVSDKKYKMLNQDKRRAYNAAYRKAHPGYYRAYAKAHPEQGRASNSRHKALKRGAAIADFTHAQWIAMQEHFKHCCAYCGKRAKGHLTQDHVTPLRKGGNHTLSNIVPACRSCNSKKGVGSVLTPVQTGML